MKLNYKNLTTSILLLISLGLYADVIKPVKWEHSLKQIDDETYEIVFKASIDKGWHLYGLNIPEGGPIATSFTFNNLVGAELMGNTQTSKKPEVKFDNTFEMELELFDGTVSFSQKIKKTTEGASIKGFIEFMACDDSRCLPPSEIEFSYSLANTLTEKTSATPAQKALPGIDTLTLVNEVASAPDKSEQKVETLSNVNSDKEPEQNRKSRWAIFWEAFTKGLLAILTPCVFPIIPLTVAFFMRDSTTGKRIFQALFFGLSIVAIYSIVGLVAGLLQIDITALTRHWLANIIIAAVLLAFAASFFGMFELVLPGSLSNKLDNKVDKGGLLAPFFLALVTAVVSFSCVGPIAGVAIGAAMNGEIITPVIAMAGFSSAFALPFVLLGIFPGMLKNMPKSGGWLNAVKVVFAFLMLVAAYIFLGNTQWALFNRDTILALNIATFILLGIYLLGKIKFAHDSDLPSLKVPRLLLAIVSFSLALYLLPGLFGSPLKALSPFLPAEETSEMNVRQAFTSNVSLLEVSTTALCHPNPRYSDKLHLPHNLAGYFDYVEGMACAQELNKPVLLDFVGHSCKNCKKMYADVWSDPQILAKLQEEFIIIALYTDDRTPLPESEWYTSTLDGKEKNTLGKKNLDFQISKFQSNALPLYAILDTNGRVITEVPYFTYNTNKKEFLNYLDEGISNFRKAKF